MTSSRSRSSAGILRISRLAVFIALFTSPALAQTSLGIPGVMAPGVAPELVQDGFTALEGPVGAADGTVYFSDRMPDRTYHLGLDGKITVYQENTGAERPRVHPRRRHGESGGRRQANWQGHP